MRIGLVTPGFSASDTDWCIPALLDLVRTLARGHEVYVLTLRYPSPAGRYRVYGATVDALGGEARRRVSRLGLLARAAFTLRREARNRRLDVLHALWAHEPGAVATRVGTHLGVPTVVSLLGGELVSLPAIGYGGQLSWSNRWLTRTALARASAVTVGSLELRNLAARHTELAKIRVAPLGVDMSRFAPHAAGAGLTLAGSPSLLCVGSWIPVKDQRTLLDALALTSGSDALPDAHLHLVGSGPCEQDLKSQTERLGLASRVTFHGAVPHDRLPLYYRAADVCVLSSRFESQAMVILEAAACGRLTIGTRVGLMTELGGDAAVVPPGEPGALADLLTTQLRPTHPPRPRVARDQLTGYALEAATDRFVTLYRELAAHGADRR